MNFRCRFCTTHESLPFQFCRNTDDWSISSFSELVIISIRKLKVYILFIVHYSWKFPFLIFALVSFFPIIAYKHMTNLVFMKNKIKWIMALVLSCSGVPVLLVTFTLQNYFLTSILKFSPLNALRWWKQRYYVITRKISLRHFCIGNGIVIHRTQTWKMERKWKWIFYLLFSNTAYFLIFFLLLRSLHFKDVNWSNMHS